ncbi:MAG: sulfurtransferase TusA family protein [Pseudomonadota bacterium]
MDKDVDVRVDVRGQCCPLPLIGLAQAMAALAPGQTLEVIGNDPIFESTIRDFCASNGHGIVAVTEGENREVALRIRVGERR